MSKYNAEKEKLKAREREALAVQARVEDFLKRNPGHKKPITRRDFLAIGAIESAAFVMMPSILSQIMLEKAARAAGCPQFTSHPYIPLLIIDGAGGFSIPGNWVPLENTYDAGGNLVASNLMSGAGYAPVGLGSNSSGITLDSRWGLQMPIAATGITPTTPSMNVGRTVTGNGAVLSKALDGMQQMLTPDTNGLDPKNNIQQGAVWFSSTSDSGGNPVSPGQLLTKLGMTGLLVKVAGNDNTETGHSSGTPAYSVDSTAKALQLSSFKDLQGALSYGQAFKNMPKKYLDALASAISKMSSSQKTKFQGMKYGDDATVLGQDVLGLGTLGNCGYQRNQAFTGATPGIDPTADSRVKDAMTGNPAGTIPGGDVVFATLIYNLLQKNVGVAGFTVGGCDYHDQSQTSGDAKDFEIGVRIGQYLKLAHLMGVPAAVMVYTDGGISANAGTRQWAGDNNDTSGIVLVTYNPDSAGGAFKFAKTQIQGYKNGGAENKGPINASVQKAGLVVAANILELSGQAARIDELFGVAGVTDIRSPDQILFRKTG
jgi:hypothetical protein